MIDTFTFQVGAEQRSSVLFSHGAVNATATTGRRGQHTGEFILAASAAFPPHAELLVGAVLVWCCDPTPAGAEPRVNAAPFPRGRGGIRLCVSHL